MDRVGYGFLAVLGIVTIGLAILGWTIWALIGLVLSIFVGAFFRDPNRNIPADKRAVVAPADGKIFRALCLQTTFSTASARVGHSALRR